MSSKVRVRDGHTQPVEFIGVRRNHHDAKVTSHSERREHRVQVDGERGDSGLTVRNEDHGPAPRSHASVEGLVTSTSTVGFVMAKWSIAVRSTRPQANSERLHAKPQQITGGPPRRSASSLGANASIRESP